MIDLTACPDPSCLSVAEIVDDYEADSTCGPVRHLVTLCVLGHHYLSTRARC